MKIKQDQDTDILLDCGTQMAETIINMVNKNSSDVCPFCKTVAGEHTYGCVYLTAEYFKDLKN